MRVDLAAQVCSFNVDSKCVEDSYNIRALSSIIAKTLEDTGGHEVTETVRFIQMVNKFFDCLNVNNLSSGKTSKKLFQDPIRKGDFRLKVCNSV